MHEAPYLGVPTKVYEWRTAQPVISRRVIVFIQGDKGQMNIRVMQGDGRLASAETYVYEEDVTSARVRELIAEYVPTVWRKPIRNKRGG